MDKIKVTKLIAFFEWITVVYSYKEDLVNESYDSAINRDTFAEYGIELTPGEFDEYKRVVLNIVDAINWFERRIDE